MPEGPEIHRVADQLSAALDRRVLREVWFAFPELARRARRLKLLGQRVRRVEARGKAMLIHFSGGESMYSHNQLYGRWVITTAGARPESSRSLRVALSNARASALLYSASAIELWPTAQLGEQPFLARLGPDVLDPRLAPAAVEKRLRELRFAERGLAGLLLDQGFLAGMGNYLRSEVLFEARIAPRWRPRDLADTQLAALAAALLAVPRRSYATRGLAEDVDSNLRRDLSTAHENVFRFRVFNRAGKACPRCGGTIRREELAGRRLYWCPGCQE